MGTQLKYNIDIIHIAFNLAELCLLGKVYRTHSCGILTRAVAVYFDSKLRNIASSISPAKVREKPPNKEENRIMGCEGRESPFTC